uniref:Methyltransferase type 12 domain-containing protein n=1 Tax=Oryza meridionalis TaxID=40149 RepID=A0A0E0CV26_9ORYZ
MAREEEGNRKPSPWSLQTKRSAMAAGEQQPQQQQISASSTSSGRLVTPFWKEKYERDARRYWDIFYKRHEDKFFKDRHYLDKEWGKYFEGQGGGKMVILEVGCGAGNTIFPLISTYPDIFVHACDFSPRAVDLVKKHKDYRPDQVNAFACDITSEQLTESVQPSSVDVVTMNGGHVLFRDYAFGDLAQERLMSKGQQISENFYVRGDGTRAYYFSNEYLVDLFSTCGFTVEEICVHNKQVENRSLDLVMNRNWIQATFILGSAGLQGPNGQHDSHTSEDKEDKLTANSSQEKSTSEEIDLSEDFNNMFGNTHNLDEAQVIRIKAKGHDFKIKMLTKEHQHTCKLTGLMLWESAQFMCSVLAENPSILAGKRVLELGCGSAGICSMVAATVAQFVVTTDGDAESLDLLRENTASNLEPDLLKKVVIRKLFWGDKDDLKAVRELSGDGTGFDCIIGTDVTYNPDAIFPLFKTARELISNKGSEAALILCYIQRRVDEDSILSTAMAQGFRLVDKWINGIHESNGIISSWFCGNDVCSAFRNATLSILYFQV